MSGIVEVRGVRIGEGIPKIIVPVVAGTKEKILEEASRVMDPVGGIPADLIEWRADFYEGGDDPAQAVHTAGSLRAVLKDTPLLFTFRTFAEGGQKEIPLPSYTELCRKVAESGLIDLLDVELSVGEEAFTHLVRAAHDAGVKVIASSHDFQGTPPKEELLRRLRRMQDLGADICKIAVMPQNPRDVLTLLDATQEMVEHFADRPLITMSMSGQGLITRLCGEVFGSAATFGAAGAGMASAPGQIDAQELRSLLVLLHDNAGL